MADTKLNLNDVVDQFKPYLKQVSRYKVGLFIALVAVIYGYSTYNINQLVNSQPSTTQVQATVNPLSLTRVDKSVVSQLQTLQNNSVSVQALFEQARNNPFHE